MTTVIFITVSIVLLLLVLFGMTLIMSPKEYNYAEQFVQAISVASCLYVIGTFIFLIVNKIFS